MEEVRTDQIFGKLCVICSFSGTLFLILVWLLSVSWLTFAEPDKYNRELVAIGDFGILVSLAQLASTMLTFLFVPKRRLAGALSFLAGIGCFIIAFALSTGD